MKRTPQELQKNASTSMFFELSWPFEGLLIISTEGQLS